MDTNVILFWLLKIVVPFSLSILLILLLPNILHFIYQIFAVTRLLFMLLIFRFLSEEQRMALMARLLVGDIPPKIIRDFIYNVQKDYLSRLIGANTANMLETYKESREEKLVKDNIEHFESMIKKVGSMPKTQDKEKALVFLMGLKEGMEGNLRRKAEKRAKIESDETNKNKV